MCFFKICNFQINTYINYNISIWLIMNPTIFKGNVEIQAGINSAIYGPGQLIVGSDATIGGDHTQINSTNLTIADNLPIVNYPAVIDGRDLGILGARSLSDITNGTPTESGTATGGTIGTIDLDLVASAVDGYYNGYIIRIVAGTGFGQIRTIVGYIGLGRVATVDQNWTVVPDGTSVYELFGDCNVAFSWNESSQTFILGTTPDMHTATNLNVMPGNLHVNNLILDGTITGLDEVVALPENVNTSVPIEKTDLTGAYLIVVEAQDPSGANATFSACKSSSFGMGTTFRITSSTGATTGTELDIRWNPDEKISLFHSITGPDPNILYYNVRIVSVDVLGGENNNGANVGTLGVGPYDGKTGVTLNFRNIVPGSTKITTVLDIPGKNILIDVDESNLTLDNIGGTLSVIKGGTSLTSLTAGRFLVGNGLGPVDLSKVVPTGVVVGTTDSQTLTNKTLTGVSNNVISRGLWNLTGSVDVSGSPAPIAGYTLVATSPTTATWQSGGGGMSEFEYNVSAIPITTTNQVGPGGTGGYDKLSWTTAAKPAGTYRLGWCYNYSIQTTTRDLIVLVMIDGTTEAISRLGVVSNAGGSNADPYTLSGSGNNQNLMSSGFKYVTFGAPGTHNIVVKFGTSQNGSGYEPVSMSDLVVEIWKV